MIFSYGEAKRGGHVCLEIIKVVVIGRSPKLD
jgi:hypothetical protein